MKPSAPFTPDSSCRKPRSTGRSGNEQSSASPRPRRPRSSESPASSAVTKAPSMTPRRRNESPGGAARAPTRGKAAAAASGHEVVENGLEIVIRRLEFTDRHAALGRDAVQSVEEGGG